MEYPEEMTPALKNVLMLLIFRTGPIAACLRLDGEDIPHKAEEEQAHVLHWMIRLALEHGPAWSEVVHERLTEITNKLDAKKEAG